MASLRLLALPAASLLGCTGLVGDGLAVEEDGDAALREMFATKAAPALSQSCTSCHAGSRGGIDFLAGEGDAVRTQLLTFAPVVVNIEAPASSRLLTKGAHDGPAFTASQLSDVLEWIRAERDAQPDPGDGEPPLETRAFTPAICTGGTAPSATCPINTVDLGELGLPGAKIEFVAQALGSALYINQLRLIAGPSGAYLEHPLFASWPETGGAPVADTIDRFFNLKMNLAANARDHIAGGTAAFVGFLATDQLSIHFKALKPYQPDAGGENGGGGMGGGGCKVLESFKTNARPLLQQSCGGCHADPNNANATSAMNITTIGDDATVQQACNQVRTRVNLTVPEQSGVFLAPDPTNNNHPFRFSAGQLATFKNGPPGTGLLGWINAEKVAP